MSGFALDAAARARARLGHGVSLEELPGDASDRRYLRARAPGLPDRVVMAMARPFDPPYEPWDRMAAFLADISLPVPRVLERHPADGLLVLEDLGDRTLQAHLDGRTDAADRIALYEEAVDLIVRLQREGTRAVRPDVPAYHFALDEIRLGRELEYFHEHYVRGLLGDPLAGTPRAAGIAAALAEVAREAGRPGDRVLCHRDFHSRNLMVREGSRAGRLVMLDFQDARLGPRAYDLASLLCDAYVDVPADLARRLTRRFLRGVGREDGEAFRRSYAWVAVQRTLKAVGTFAGQARRFGVDRYLAYIPRALGAAREQISRLPEMAALRAALDGPLAYPGGP